MSADSRASGAEDQRLMLPLATATIVVLLLGLPLALWLDLRSVSEQILRQESDDLGHAINDVRDFYAKEVVDRILAVHGDHVTTTEKFRGVAGGVPIPATFSIELGQIVSSRETNMQYRFVSDYPFAGRDPHRLGEFEKKALAALRADPNARIAEVGGAMFDRSLRVATPVIMGQSCVNCHNAHPDSPKKDWKVGNVRGIQVITVRQPINGNVFAFKFLLIYMLVAAGLGGLFIWMQKRQASMIDALNKELAGANEFLAGISAKISRYLSPQIYKSIFTGQKDVAIATERKKLTIFFSDVKDFTETTERMQPEELTALLNEYLTEMSKIALAHGGTVDKFIGDAILVFFGDPETKGAAEDARCCVRMAAAMQRRLVELAEQWRNRGIEFPFRCRMGINTGYCNVGNFGSDERMDYTIIGAEANLAARLQSIGEAGKIVLSYETYALVSDMVRARPLDPISMKGISRKVIPYLADALIGEHADKGKVISERAKGLNLYLDTEMLDRAAATEARKALQDALAALNEIAPA